VLAVNLSGPLLGMKHAAPAIARAGGGSIVNITSVAPEVGGAGIESPYAATKGGVDVLTRACAHEGGPWRIRANSVGMGLVTGTKFVDDHPELLTRPDAMGPLGALPSASDIAEAAAFLASDRAAFITGEKLSVSGGAFMRY